MDDLIEFLKEKRKTILTKSIGEDNVDFNPLLLSVDKYKEASFENALKYMREKKQPAEIKISTPNK
jgi:hypothetical protein